ncbi:helix-turn-helix domain-containing protein [Aequorivita vladivostokensis]|nr:helix-turn-helix transcriptional regulator [Aequorivita vladivostokensis]
MIEVTINANSYMNKKINSLALHRTRANISLNDVAYLLNIDTSNLSRIEKGIRKPNVRIILLYHILFDAPLINLFGEQFNTLKEKLIGRSRKLIAQLETEQPPKSKNRIAYMNRFVKYLNESVYDE